MIVELASSIAVYAMVALAYAILAGRPWIAVPRYRQIAIGAILGAGALGATFAQHAAGHPERIADDIVAVGLAAPLGGVPAAIIAGAIALTSFLWPDGQPVYPGLIQVPLSASIGIALTLTLQLEGSRFGIRRLIALAFCQSLGAALLLAPAYLFHDVPAETGLTFIARIFGGTIILGGLLQRWGEAEGRIGDTERRWRALVANVPGAVMEITVPPSGEMQFVFATAEAARVFGDGALGLSADEKRVLQTIHADDRAAFRRSLAAVGGSAGQWSHEFRVVIPGGKQRWLRGQGVSHANARGDVVWDAIVVNVTSRKDVEQTLRRSEALQRLLAENTMEMIGRIGPDQTWLYVSPSAHDILGHEPGELIGRPWLAIVDDADIVRVKDRIAGLVPGGRALTLRYRVRQADGNACWVEETRRLTGKGGEDPAAAISVIRPIDADPAEPLVPAAERERAGDGEGERDGRFARMLEAANAGIILADARQVHQPLIFANRAVTAMTGYSRAELMGRSWELLKGADADPAIIGQIEDALRHQQPVSTALLGRRKDGSAFWTKLDFSPVRDAAGRVDAYLGILMDISEQKRIEDALRQARDAAEAANRAKSDFIANVSHELRTPLNGVIGFTNLLLNEKLPAEQRRYATFAHDAGSSLLAIINNILDLSKIEAGKLTLVETDFSVIELAVSCNTVVWHAARERGLDLNFVLKPDVTSLVRGDPDRIRQVLLNLLSNAVKFTEKGSVVLTIAKLRDSPTGAILKFSVTDTGIGIAKEQQSRLFHKFSQIEDKAGIYLRGTGLGLAICKNLVEGMGGEIGVTSAPNLGSNFWFTIPLKPAAGAGREAEDGRSGPHRSARILLVEDQPMNQELMITLLQRAGHKVEVAGDGEAAVKAVQQREFDLVLMDVQLPRMDGVAATRAIRGLGTAAADIPIIAMTARALASDVERCLAAGMDDHLSKPVDAAALLAMINRWAASRDVDADEPPEIKEDQLPVQDHNVLRDLATHLGPDKLDDLIFRARTDLPSLLERIDAHRSDPVLVERMAHELVSIAGTAGLAELVDRARATMEVCREGNEAQLAASLAGLDEAARRALSALESRPRAGVA
jgi:PAS domain S-box-containing protein